jgi:tetratricopeptide (TPR) repeat protein
LEFDRATGTIETWLVGPGPGEIETIEVELEESPEITTSEELDQWFLEGLVLNGHAHWGGERGLTHLVERFGRTSLLVAAQVADRLEHHSEDPASALQLARTRWPSLNDHDEVPWATLAERRKDAGHPFICAQLGRLALRLGLLRAARALLSASAGSTDVSPIAWFDLGQACEALDDLTGAENAFTRYASTRPQDPDAWRRLLFCRLRRDRSQLAEECLRKYHSAGGKDEELVERYLHVVARGRIRTAQRGFLAAFLLPHLRVAFSTAGRDGDVEREIVRLCFCDDPTAAAAFTALVSRLRGELAVALRLSGNQDFTEDTVRAVLLTLPFLGPLHQADELADVEALADDVQSTINRWAEAPAVAAALMGPPPLVDSRSLYALAAMANSVWDDHEGDAYSDEDDKDDDENTPEEHQ